MTSTVKSPPNAAPSPWYSRAVPVLPWLIAGTALAVLAWRYSPSRVAAEMSRGNALAILPYAAGLTLLTWVVVSAGDWVAFRSCLTRPSFGQLMRGMAGAAVVNLFGYVAGLSAYAVWLSRAAACSVSLAGGLVIYIVSSELSAVVLCVGAAGGLSALALPWSAVLLGLAAMLVVLKIGQPPWWPRAWRASPWLKPWLTISRGWATAELSLRVLQIVVLTVGTWLAAGAFGIVVPFGDMMTRFPIILLVAALPINIAGFGALQGAWLLLLPWARSGEQVIAFSLLWQLSTGLMTLLRGAPFLRGAVRAVTDDAAPLSS